MQSNAKAKFAELNQLLSWLCDGYMDRPDWDRLETLLLDDPSAQDYYRLFVALDVDLAWRADGRFAGLPFEPTATESENEGQDAESAILPLPAPPAIILSPLPSTFSPPSSFVGGPVFSYTVAAVVLGVMLLGAWAYKITHFQQIAEAPAAPSSERSALVFVGQITGMVDCRWADPQTEAYAWASVPLGRKYALASGLMEITYTTGAKVILQGPCTYEVESRAGGYLSLGKLTARVETDKEARRQGDKERMAGDTSPRSLSPGLPVSPSFFVCTPTAIVTDLGTEFGVEVGNEGNTTSHVFRGSVKVQAVGDGQQREVVLRANESARVEKGKDAGDARLVTGGEVGDALKFVRRLVEPPKVLDLLDIVAGGNGTGNRRERGIDPVTGMEDPMFLTHYRGGDRQYWPVGWHRLIDGVFVPDGSAGAVQIDSAGHTFDGFPETNGEAYGSIWPRAADIGSKRLVDRSQPWMYAMLSEEQFMPEGRGLLGFYANGGITFDLEAMRKMYPNVRPARFSATAGLADVWFPDPAKPYGLVDLWVFVDGRLKLKREKIRAKDGAFKVDVELGPGDRFLTLAATDGGNGISWDSVVFGDPVLEMTPTKSEDK